MIAVMSADSSLLGGDERSSRIRKFWLALNEDMNDLNHKDVGERCPDGRADKYVYEAVMPKKASTHFNCPYRPSYCLLKFHPQS